MIATEEKLLNCTNTPSVQIMCYILGVNWPNSVSAYNTRREDTTDSFVLFLLLDSLIGGQGVLLLSVGLLQLRFVKGSDSRDVWFVSHGSGRN